MAHVPPLVLLLSPTHRPNHTVLKTVCIRENYKPLLPVNVIRPVRYLSQFGEPKDEFIGREAPHYVKRGKSCKLFHGTRKTAQGRKPWAGSNQAAIAKRWRSVGKTYDKAGRTAPVDLACRETRFSSVVGDRWKPRLSSKPSGAFDSWCRMIAPKPEVRAINPKARLIML